MIAFPPDITFVIQIISFFVLWLGLKRLMFDPLLQVIDERKARTTGVMQEAGRLRSGAASAEAQFDQRMVDVRAELSRETDTARHATEEEEHRVLAIARDQSAALLKERRDQLRAEADAARSQLAGEASQLARLIAGKVVGGDRA
jgi:F-type H+-transporting ATPase subunit b